jgi:osmotically-inducible protein OsmY
MKAKLFFILGLMAFPMLGAMAMSSHKAIQQESTGQYVDNSVITLKVKSKLLADPEIKAFAISVSSNRGQVTLSGNVATFMQKEKAGKLAKQVEGVTSVINNLMVMRNKKR